MIIIQKRDVCFDKDEVEAPPLSDGQTFGDDGEFAKKMDKVFLETNYQGNPLIIGADSHPHRNVVNWYGQLINAGSMHLRFISKSEQVARSTR